MRAPKQSSSFFGVPPLGGLLCFFLLLWKARHRVRLAQDDRGARRRALAERKQNQLPWHRPPHGDWGEREYLLSAACYEHAPIIGTTTLRMGACEEELLATLNSQCETIYAWCVLPNHYHALVYTSKLRALLRVVGQFHGRTSWRWNGEEGKRGRQVWHDGTDRAMRSPAHFWTTLNYVHHNPVRHGYVEKWQDWPFSSAKRFPEEVGREKAERIWRAYPILDYGKGWDAPES